MGFIFHFAELVDEASDDLFGQCAQHMYVSGYFSEIAKQNRLEDRTAFKWAQPPWDPRSDEAHLVDGIHRADAPNIYEVPSEGTKGYQSEMTSLTFLDDMAE
eukprot:1383124-Karenia_brevis.AAC.1